MSYNVLIAISVAYVAFLFLVAFIAERAAETGYRVLFFGGTDDVGERAAEILRAEYPGLDVLALTGMVGADGETDPELLAQIGSRQE